MPEKLFWMCKVIFLLGQRSNVDFYFSERKKEKEKIEYNTDCNRFTWCSVTRCACSIYPPFCFILFWCPFFPLLLLAKILCWWCSVCMFGWWGVCCCRHPPPSQAAGYSTVAYHSKAKCQYFKAITFEPRGPPSLGCYRNSLAKRKWVGVPSRHFISFSIWDRRRQDTVHLPNATEKYYSSLCFSLISPRQKATTFKDKCKCHLSMLKVWIGTDTHKRWALCLHPPTPPKKSPPSPPARFSFHELDLVWGWRTNWLSLREHYLQIANKSRRDEGNLFGSYLIPYICI